MTLWGMEYKSLGFDILDLLNSSWLVLNLLVFENVLKLVEIDLYLGLSTVFRCNVLSAFPCQPSLNSIKVIHLIIR